MFDEFFKYCGENWPKLTFFIIVAILLVIMVWIMAKKFFHWTNRIMAAEEKCKTIDSHLSPKLESINLSINTLSGNLNSLVVYLKSKDNNMDASLFVSRSPVQLTRLGEDILSAIGGKKFIDDNVDFLLKELESQNTKTALDVQTSSPIIINNISTKDIFNPIKDYIFRTPVYKAKNANGVEISINLDMNVVSNIMGIYLRNKYLELHPDLAPGEEATP